MSGFDLDRVREAVRNGRTEWQRHILERMLERSVGRNDVLGVLLSGEMIESYPDDFPFPSALIFGWARKRPLHVVAAFDEGAKIVPIITAYEPDAEHFEKDFKTRKLK